MSYAETPSPKAMGLGNRKSRASFPSRSRPGFSTHGGGLNSIVARRATRNAPFVEAHGPKKAYLSTESPDLGAWSITVRSIMAIFAEETLEAGLSLPCRCLTVKSKPGQSPTESAERPMMRSFLNLAGVWRAWAELKFQTGMLFAGPGSIKSQSPP
ncbi:hypothetical protein VTI74DRAFT_6136 [Chaetomium olivicolor]